MWSRLLVLLLAATVAFRAPPGVAADEEADPDADDYNSRLKVGSSIDIFTRYGYLSLSMKVVPRNDSGPAWIFREPTVDIFKGIDSLSIKPHLADKKTVFEGDFHMEFCDNLRQLLQAYFRDFSFEKLDNPWRAFTGSWSPDTIARHLGINASFVHRDHCYVLVRLSRFRDTAKLLRLPNNISLEDMVVKEMDNVKVGDVASVLMFIRKYGSHYINSYVTGNSLYQVFVYKKRVYQRLKDRLKARGIADLNSLELSNYFSPWYAEHLGRIKVASGNRTVEQWAASTLRVHYYIFTYPSLLKIHGDTRLLSHLNDLLKNEALLEVDMRSLAPAFKEPEKRQWFLEVLDNFLKLWEVNL